MQDTQLYRPVLKNAFAFAWKEKRFWILAFFATLMMSGGIYDLAFRRWSDATGRGIAAGLPEEYALPNVLELVASVQSGVGFPVWMMAALGIALVVAVIFVWLAIASQGALIAAAAGVRHSSLATGNAHFWKLFWINIGNKIAIGVALFILGIPATMLAAGAPEAVGLSLTAFIILIPLVLIISFLSLYAMTAVVVREESVGGAVAHAWRTFTAHWLVSLEMAFIIFGIDVLAALAISLGLFVAALPFILLLIAAAALGSAAGVSFIMAALALALLGLVFAVGSFLTALRYSAWTGLFLRFEKKRATSKILRLLHATT